jgi:hypothetical protein
VIAGLNKWTFKEGVDLDESKIDADLERLDPAEARDSLGYLSSDPFPPRETTTERPRVETAPRVTGTKSVVVGGAVPPAPAASTRPPPGWSVRE